MREIVVDTNVLVAALRSKHGAFYQRSINDCRAAIITYNKRDFIGTERFRVAVRTPAESFQILRGEQ